jgi:CheY-like chemotaxis protein
MQMWRPEKPAPPAEPLEGRQVLLVEDSPDQRRLFAALLEYAGATVTLECNGEAAVATATQSPTPFDAIVMDLSMPIMDGIEATRQLRSRGYEGAIVGITAHDTEGLEDSWIKAGCDAYLTKPLDTTALVNTVHRLIPAVANEPIPV